MIRKTTLLAGVAGALLMTAPAFAQETPQDTPPATDTPAATETQATPAAPQRLELQPGATVRGADGELGKLEGARRNPAGQQELTVRGADGQLRAVPLNGLKQEGADIVVGWTTAEYQAAPALTGEAAPATPASPAAPAMPATPATPGMTPATPADPATPATPADPSMPAAPVEPAEGAMPPAPSESAEPVDPATEMPADPGAETESEPQ